jgi:hypothetical protein
LTCLAAARLAAEAAVQLSADTEVQISAKTAVLPMPPAQISLPPAQINRPEPNQPQPISPRQIQDPSEPAVAAAVSASQETTGQNISQELVLLLVLSLLTLLDGAKALRQLLMSTEFIWRPRPRWPAALPGPSGALGAQRIHQLGLGDNFQPGAEGIQQRSFAQLAGTVLLSSRPRN